MPGFFRPENCIYNYELAFTQLTAQTPQAGVNLDRLH